MQHNRHYVDKGCLAHDVVLWLCGKTEPQKHLFSLELKKQVYFAAINLYKREKMTKTIE